MAEKGDLKSFFSTIRVPTTSLTTMSFKLYETP